MKYALDITEEFKNEEMTIYKLLTLCVNFWVSSGLFPNKILMTKEQIVDFIYISNLESLKRFPIKFKGIPVDIKK